ncbi:hypothetical protein TorRG33x02_203210 [Trema orientale]|uniref:Uncharacterized protein n=1 Tax=Trema orientale TaxID=63057 RepID=A0A2P5EEC0_TREOI|nr:hypothetical protein TorRG33x02_203210 [Trema orientale]
MAPRTRLERGRIAALGYLPYTPCQEDLKALIGEGGSWNAFGTGRNWSFDSYRSLCQEDFKTLIKEGGSRN